jgi:phosphatidylethanolamine/phosphatidyl-N-methylethanolamine N-methyltransferase
MINHEAVNTFNGGEESCRLTTETVKTAYRHQAPFYDVGFGMISGIARRKAIEAVNGLSGKTVLEVGVGTGLALPHYNNDKIITGIDLSTDMLNKAKKRVEKLSLSNVSALLEMNAEDMDFEDNSFDIAIAMFVASVVPNPMALKAEMRRVVKPDGHILFINHFAVEDGLVGKVEKALSKISQTLGWHPDFQYDFLFNRSERRTATMKSQWPMGLFTLVKMDNL